MTVALDYNCKSAYKTVSSRGTQVKDTAEFFRVLADQARLEMLWLLFNHGELCVCDFIEVLGITQSKASRHLRILYRAGLVTDRRDGLWVYYALRPLPPEPVRAQLAELRVHLASRPAAAQLLEKLTAWRDLKGSGARRMRRFACAPGLTGPQSGDECAPPAGWLSRPEPQDDFEHQTEECCDGKGERSETEKEGAVHPPQGIDDKDQRGVRSGLRLSSRRSED